MAMANVDCRECTFCTDDCGLDGWDLDGWDININNSNYTYNYKLETPSIFCEKREIEVYGKKIINSPCEEFVLERLK